MIMMPKKIGPVGSPLRVNQIRQYAPASASQAGSSGEKFDKITLSARESGEPRRMELQSKLSQEVRTATTTGTLTSLRDQVQSGEYRIDAGSIAKKMLLLGEV